jgi:hypothetical protein
MISNRWIALRHENWNKLEAMVQRVETSSLKTLSPDDLRDFGLLYRQAAADLSAARADPSSRTLEAYLNQLVSRAHNYIYSGQRLSAATVGQFLLHGYPRIFRRLLPYTAAALVVCCGRRAAGDADHPRSPGVYACHAGAGDGQHHRTPQDVDRLDPKRQAAGLQRHHDQQHHRLLPHLRRRDRRRPGNDLSVVQQRTEHRRRRHRLRPERHGAQPLELRRRPWRAGVAVHLHRRRRGAQAGGRGCCFRECWDAKTRSPWPEASRSGSSPEPSRCWSSQARWRHSCRRPTLPSASSSPSARSSSPPSASG